MKKIIVLLFLCGFTHLNFAQNTTASSTVFIPPAMSYEAINALSSPIPGSMVYDNSFKVLRLYNGAKWIPITSQEPSLIAIQAWKAGGTAYEEGESLAVDSSGNVYVTGFFQSTATFGTGSLSSAGGSDIFVAKYTNTGILQWVQKAGGTGMDIGRDIAVDATGNVYVTGHFQNTFNFGTTSLTSSGGSDIFVAKYDTDGTFQWVQKAGAAGDDSGKGIAVAPAGDVYVTGQFLGAVTFGSHNLTSTAGSVDVFVTKCTTAGVFQWAQKAGGVQEDIGEDIAVDGNGNVCVTGSFEVTAAFNSASLSSAGGKDIFIAKYNNDGTLQWAIKAGGSNNDIGFGIAVDGNAHVYVTGQFGDVAAFSPLSLTSAGGDDAFVAGYTAGGALKWAKKVGGMGTDVGYDIKVDVNANVYITGFFAGTFSIASATLSSIGGADIFAVKYTGNGTFQWAQQAGSVSSDLGIALAIGIGGNVYLTGYFQSTANFLTTNLTSAGYQDIFVMRIVE